MVNDLALMPILVGGSEEQHAPSSPRSAPASTWRLLSDRAGAGSDVSSMSTTAKRDGDSYILNGTKTFITNGSVAASIPCSHP